ncbi:TIGR00730 family Rossman fold protein [Aestuariispira insulae]|uniref:Cytokinin riboside 5'-monophosphate phosphoribohydrolase n=1 Tax=Aestuariispira insulae TaxID=1461337 RepID=A0A3D9HXH9_9PROT|nr:TIGR00730 family Rossman fold protein [Aestuariispira insulae]RED53606.1 hypothetical protein DFP90_101397 [Aestuariispira insulae]
MPNIKSVCVYCGSSSNVRESYRQCAIDFGRQLAESGRSLVYGGGKVGLMGLVADSTINNGGEVLGVIPEFLRDLEVGHGGVTELVITENMHERKMIMAERADAFVALPGGLGTLDETFEILTWKQLKLHDKPVIILNIDGYWDSLIELIHKQVAENFAKEANLELFQVVTSVEEAIEALEKSPAPTHDIESKWT